MIRNIYQYHFSSDNFDQQSGTFKVKINRPTVNGRFLNKIAVQDICFPRSQYTLNQDESSFLVWRTGAPNFVQAIISLNQFYNVTTFLPAMKTALESIYIGQTIVVDTVQGRIRIQNQTTPADEFRFRNLSQDLINILGFRPTVVDGNGDIQPGNFNVQDNYYFLDDDNQKTSPGILNLNSTNSFYTLQCDQCRGGYDTGASSQVLAHVYLYTIPFGAYYIQTYDTIYNMREFTNDSDFLSIRIRDKNNKIVTLADLNGVDIQFTVALFQYD